MSTSSKHIGLAVHFRSSDYDSTISYFNRIVPHCNAILDEFRKLSTPFPEVNNDLVKNLDSTTERKMTTAYTQLREGEIQKLGITSRNMLASFKAEIQEDLQPLTGEFNKLRKKQEEIRSYSNGNLAMSTAFLELQDDKVILGQSGLGRLKDHFSTYVENEAEAEIWQGFVEVQEAYNTQVVKLKEIGIRVDPILRPMMGPQGFLYQNQNALLEINGDYLHGIRRALKEKESPSKIPA